MIDLIDCLLVEEVIFHLLLRMHIFEKMTLGSVGLRTLNLRDDNDELCVDVCCGAAGRCPELIKGVVSPQ